MRQQKWLGVRERNKSKREREREREREKREVGVELALEQRWAGGTTILGREKYVSIERMR